MRPILFITLFCCVQLNFCQTSIGVIPVGAIHDNTFIFNDSTALKKKIIGVLSSESNPVTISKIEVVQMISIGESAFTVFLLQCYDSIKKRTITRCLHSESGMFYLKDFIEGKTSDDELFFASYFVTYDCDEDCLPYVAIVDGKRTWASNKQMMCIPNSKCKSSTVIVY